MTLTVENIRSIASLRYNVDISIEDVPIKMIQVVINTLQSDSIKPEEAIIGHFTRRKPKKLLMWNEWKKSEHKQSNQFHDQKMFGSAIANVTLPKNAIILRPHWNFVVKRLGVRCKAMLQRIKVCCIIIACYG